LLKGPEGAIFELFKECRGWNYGSTFEVHRLLLEAPLSVPRNGPDFEFGVVFVERGSIVLLRIRDYLRRTGLARAGLREILRERRLSLDASALTGVRRFVEARMGSEPPSDLDREILDLTSPAAIQQLRHMYISVLSELSTG
jgi:hypothetical protein